MRAWFTYFIERIALTPFLIVTIGMAASGILIDQGRFSFFPFLISFIGIGLIFIFLRIDNDLKDFEKDRIAFPNRPLPRGLLKRMEVASFLRYLQIVIAAYTLMMLFLLPWKVGITYCLSILYLRLMTSKEWLKNDPLEHLLFRQGLVIPVAFFAVAMGHPHTWVELNSICYAFILFGAFGTNEICRKLDPLSHPILLGLTHFYGFKITFWAAFGFLLISAIGAFILGVYMILWPCELAVLIALTLLFKTPRRYQIAEIAASLSLIVHSWAGVLNFVLGMS